MYVHVCVHVSVCACVCVSVFIPCAMHDPYNLRHLLAILCVQLESPGDNSTRTVLHTDEYMQVVFYDHVTRLTA